VRKIVVLITHFPKTICMGHSVNVMLIFLPGAFPSGEPLDADGEDAGEGLYVVPVGLAAA
jgi:hypothetical protein